jgi:pyridoxine kinase
LSSPKAILSIQSEVVTGHVGNAAARFALQRLGHDVWAVPTVLLSSHAGHPGFAGEATSATLLGKLLDALEAQGRLAEADAVLSGYLGSAEQAPLIATAVARVRDNGRTPLYCLDTAFGDDGRVYARPGVSEAMRDLLLPLADIVRGNAFEIGTLSGTEIVDVDSALDAAQKLARPIVVVTSVPVEDELGTLLATRDRALLATTPRIAAPPHGAGDLFTALLFGHMVSGAAVDSALQSAVRSTCHILGASDGAPEMALIAEQSALVSPPDIEGFALTAIDLRRRAHG